MYSLSIKRLVNVLQANFTRPAPRKQWRIFAGDLVQVVKGADKGKQGKIIKVLRYKEQALVEGINIKQEEVLFETENRKKGEIELITEPIDVKMINLIDPSINKPTRVRTGYLEDGTMVRISKKTGTIIPKPSTEHLSYVNKVKDRVDGPLDTLKDKAHEVTYTGEDFGEIRKEFDLFIAEKEKVEKLLVFDH